MVSGLAVTFAFAAPPFNDDDALVDEKACLENDISGEDDDRGDDNNLKLVKEPDTKRRFIEKFVVVVAVVREEKSLLFGIESSGVSCTNVTPLIKCEYDSFHLGVVLVGIFSKKSLDKISSISCRQLLTSESISA